VTLQVDKKTAKRYGLGRKVTRVGRKAKSFKARKRGIVFVKFTKKAVRAVGRVRVLRLRVTIVAKDKAGNHARKVRRVTLR
jgi:hypothetical protein